MKRLSLLTVLVLNYAWVEAQNIAINTTGSQANTSAGLDVDFTNKGLLIPRVSLSSTTDATTIATPATSLLVYNSNAAMTGGSGVGYYYNAGTSGSPNWVRMLSGSGSSGSAWLLLGNSGTTAGTNFLGTTDAQDVVIKANSTEGFRLYSGGVMASLGVGTTVAPSTTSAYSSFVMKGSTSNFGINLQDGGGRTSLLWNASGTGGNYLVSSEPATRMTMSINGTTGGLFGFYGAAAGTAGSPITWLQTGYISSNDQIWFSPRGTSSDFYIPAATGYIGVGTTTPGVKMDIVSNNVSYGGQLRLAATDYDQITFYNSGAMTLNAANRLGDIYYDIAGTALNIENQAGNKYVNLNQSGGNVGIGTAAPAYKLDVQGGSARVGTLYGTSVMYGTLGSFDTRATNPWPETYNMGVTSEFKANASNSLADGGTYNSVLSIRQWSAATDWSGGGVHQLGFTQNGNIWQRYSQTTGAWGPWAQLLTTASNGYIKNQTTLQSSANYNISGSGNVQTSFQLQGTNAIFGNANDIYGNIRVIQNNSATLQDGMYINYNSTGGAAAHLKFYANGTTERMRIDASTGNVGIGTGASPAYRLTVQGVHATSQIRLFSDEYGQGLTGANTANMTLWASEPGMTWNGVGIGNNVYNTTSFPRVTTTRGGSYMRLLDNSINFDVVSSTGTDITGLKVSPGSYGFGGIAIGQYHTLSSHSNSWLYMGDENGNIYGGRGLALANAYVAGAFYYPNGTQGAGKVLVSDASGYASWSTVANIMQVFTVPAAQTLINSTSYIDVSGLSQTITTTAPCYFIINTTGSLESQGPTGWGNTVSACMVKLEYNGNTLTEQGTDIANNNTWAYVVSKWAINYTLSLPAGTYTFKVAARSYLAINSAVNGVWPFLAGGASTTTLPSDGTMTIQVVQQ